MSSNEGKPKIPSDKIEPEVKDRGDNMFAIGLKVRMENKNISLEEAAEEGRAEIELTKESDPKGYPIHKEALDAAIKFLRKRSRGFTLIELLFVVAIIGVLSSVVLASLSSSKSNSVNAAIKANLSNTIAQADRFYDQNGGSYCSSSCVCDAGAIDGIGPLVVNAAKQLSASASVLGNAQAFVYNTNGTSAGSSVCHNVPGGGWAAIVSLKKPTTPNSGWCVDYTGASKEATVLTVNSVICGS